MNMLLFATFLTIAFSEIKFGCPTPRKYFQISDDVEVKCLSVTKKASQETYVGISDNFRSDEVKSVYSTTVSSRRLGYLRGDLETQWETHRIQ